MYKKTYFPKPASPSLRGTKTSGLNPLLKKLSIINCQLLIGLALMLAPLAAKADIADYNATDIAVIESIIDNNGLLWPKATAQPPASVDAAWMTANWTGVTWDGAATDQRIIYLSVASKSLTGTLDVSALTSLKSLRCNNNSISVLDVSALASLELLDCFSNFLTSLVLNGSATYTNIIVSGNLMTNETAVSGCPLLTTAADWDGTNFIFWPQRQTYDTGDIAAINAMIASNGLTWTTY